MQAANAAPRGTGLRAGRLYHPAIYLFRHALSLERADPHRRGDKERAHANQRNDVLEHIGHGSLLFLMCLHFVLFLFEVSRTAIKPPDTRGGEG